MVTVAYDLHAKVFWDKTLPSTAEALQLHVHAIAVVIRQQVQIRESMLFLVGL